MSQMELQLSTKKAQEQLIAVEKSLGTLNGALQAVGKNAGAFDEFTKSLAGLKPIKASTANNLEKIGDALKGIKGTKHLTDLAKNLNSLEQINMKGVASSVGTLSKNLAKIKIPPGLSKMATDLRKVAKHAGQAAAATNAFKTSTKGIRSPRALATVNRQMQKMPANFNKATTAAQAFNNTMRTGRNLAAGFGIALGAMGLRTLVAGATQAVMTFEQFNVVMGVVTGSAEGAADALAFVRDLSKSTSINVGVLLGSFQKFSAAALTAGLSMEKNKKIFTSMSKTFRVLGLSTENQRLAFMALEQMISKGKVSSEELRRQLGERVAGAFNLAAKSMGKTTAEFSKMLQNGEVFTDTFLPKFAAEMDKTFSKGLPESLKKVSAAIDTMGSAWFEAQLAFGTAFWDAAKESLHELAASMNSPEFREFAADMGKLVGFLASTGMQVIKFFTDNIIALKAVMAVGSVLAFAAAFKTVGLMIGLATGFIGSSITSLGLFSGAVTALGGTTGIIAGVAAAFRGVAFAVNLMWAATGPLGIALKVISAALVIAVPLLIQWWSATDDVTESTKKLNEEQTRSEEAAKKSADAAARVKREAILAADANRTFGKTFEPLAASTSTFNDKAKVTVDQLSEQDKAFAEAAKKADILATEAGKAAKGQDGVADSSGSATSKLKSNAAAAREAAKAYNELARAARAAASAQGGGGGGSAGSGRKGGMAGALPQSQSVSAGAFAGAPSFAEGTANTSSQLGSLPGGGIPSILHANEAVVPLSGGRSIPVSISEDGSSASVASNASDDVVRTLIKILDAINAGGITTPNRGTIGGSFSVGTNPNLGFQRPNGGGGGAGTAREFMEMANRDRSKVDRFGNALAGASDDIAEVDKIAREYWLNYNTTVENANKWALRAVELGFKSLSEVEQFNKSRGVGNATRTEATTRGNVRPSGGGYALVLTRTPGLETNENRSLLSGVENANTGGQLTGKGFNGQPFETALMGGSGGRSQGDIAAGYQQKRAGFAKGSPNVFKEAMGRSANVNIHPNEAVIPLPDGRAVPVMMPGERAGGSSESTRPGSTGSRGGVSVTAPITIVANNPSEFEKSKAKMEAEVANRMKRAARRSGLSEGPR